MHIRGIKIVFLVPCGGRKHDIGIHAGGGHTEIQRHQQVELAFRRFVMPHDIFRLDATEFSEVNTLHTVAGAQQMLQEILMSFAAGAEDIRAPDEHIARPVLRRIRVIAGEFEISGFQPFGNRFADILAGFFDDGTNLKRIALELRSRWQPAHTLRFHVAVDKRKLFPFGVIFQRRQNSFYRKPFIAPLITVGIEERGGILLAWWAVPVGCEGQWCPAGLRA